MADFPDSIYSPRDIENKSGVSYVAAKKTVIFAEDVENLNNEVVAIEDFLLPQYIFAHIGDTVAVVSAGTFQDILFNDEAASPKKGIVHDHTTDPEEFLITKAGVYQVNVSISFEDSSVSPDSDVAGRVVLNGTEIPGSLAEHDISGTPQSEKDKHLNISIFVTCAANDVLKVQFTASSTNVSLKSHGTYGDHKDTAVINILKIG